MVRASSMAGGIVIAVIVLTAAWLAPVKEPAASIRGQVVEAEGILVSVDQDAGAVMIAGEAGTQEFYVTPDTVIELGRTKRIEFRDLANFIGTASVVKSADTGVRQDANRVTLLVMPFRGTLPAGKRDPARLP